MSQGFRGYLKNFWKGCETLLMSLKTTLPYMIGASNTYKEVTEEYPDRISARMPEDLPPRYRGFLRNDIERCSGCRYCTEVCPIDCIHIETEPGPERNVSWVAVFDVDHARCMFCGLCVEVCPTKSLEHTREYQGSVFRLDDLVQSYGRGYATREMKQHWVSEQSARDARAEEQAWLDQSPVGAELRRRTPPEGGK
jgi:NADH-quinone oxidoreductase subunit I/NAD(P)H-quinone oxidoreductase subunit I